MVEQNTSRKNSNRLLGESRQDYIKYCLGMIQLSKKMIRAMNRLVLAKPALSEEISGIVKAEKLIIEENLREIKNG